jgi:hypothetical protein
MVMETSWIVPCYRALSGVGRALPARSVFITFGGLMLAAFLLTRIMYSLRFRVSARRLFSLVFLTTGALTVVYTFLYAGGGFNLHSLTRGIVQSFQGSTSFIPHEFEVILLSILFWTRGVLLSQRWMSVQVVLRSFRVGAFCLLMLGLLPSLPPETAPSIEVYIFLLSGLVSMGAGRASELSQLRGGGENPFNRTWLLGIASGAVLIVGCAAILAVFSADNLASPAARLALWIMEGVLLLIVLLLSPLILIGLVIVPEVLGNTLPDLLEQLERSLNLSALREILVGVLELLLALLSGLIDLALRLLELLSQWSGLRPYFLLGIIFVAVLVLFKLVSRVWRAPRRRDGVKDTRQSILDWNGFVIWLRTALETGTKRIVKGLEILRGGGRLLAAARIRRIYSRMMRMWDELGHPRQAAETPLEYLTTVSKLYPDLTGDLTHITRAYVQVRYGETPETRQEVLRVEEAWKSVREFGDARRRAQKGSEPNTDGSRL